VTVLVDIRPSVDILLTTEFWAALGSIILANVLLSGDNAVVIAMAARGLPARQQKSAIVFGSGAAIVMRIALTLIAVKMLGLPWLKLAGGLALLWIGANLMSDEEEQHDRDAKTIGVGAAVRTILLADLVMSLDNVLAVAAAAQGNTLLLIIGLAVSIPLIVFGSTLILKVMERFPVIITAGAALLGWLAGEMMSTDPAIRRWFVEVPESAVRIAGVIGAVLVVIVGKLLQRRAKSRA
jgi:YjbE family integral membrane protein